MNEEERYERLMAFGERVQEEVRQRNESEKRAKREAEERRQRDEYWLAIRKLDPKYPLINKSFVYFLKNLKGNQVKIGWSWSVYDRVTTISNRLFGKNGVVIGLFYGGRDMELRCHSIFEEYRIGGTNEVFFFSDWMSQYLQNVMTDEEKEFVSVLNNHVLERDDETGSRWIEYGKLNGC